MVLWLLMSQTTNRLDRDSTERVQRLILCARRDIALDCEMSEKFRHLAFTHFTRMSLIVKANEPDDPVDVALLGPDAVVANANGLSNFVEER